jgi:large subunit ribosomal protein L14e
MSFNRFVEAGRVCLINYGPLKGKICVIVDIIDNNKCLIDGTETNEYCVLERQKINYRRLSLTDFKIDIPRNASFPEMKKAFEEADIAGKWEATSWARKLASKRRRASLSDFDRFKVMVLRKKRAAALKK